MNHATHAIPELDRKGLREFGLMTGGIVAGLFGLLLPWLLEHALPLWPWIIAGILGLWALVAPQMLNPVYRLWMRFGLLMSRVTTPIILGIVFFLVIAPVGFVMRLFTHDPMARRFDDNIESYRVPSRKAPKHNLEKPF